jgi:hypothetical protein
VIQIRAQLMHEQYLTGGMQPLPHSDLRGLPYAQLFEILKKKLKVQSRARGLDFALVTVDRVVGYSEAERMWSC